MALISGKVFWFKYLPTEIETAAQQIMHASDAPLSFSALYLGVVRSSLVSFTQMIANGHHLSRAYFLLISENGLPLEANH